MLAGLLRDPSYTNPFVNSTLAKARQGQVLDAMVRVGQAAPCASRRASGSVLKMDAAPSPCRMFLRFMFVPP